MIWFRLFLFFQLALWLQIKLPETMLGQYFSLELVFVSVVLFGATNGIRAGLMAGLIGGGLQDALSLSPLGFNMLVFSLSGAVAGWLRVYYFLYSKWNQTLVVAGLSLLLTFYRFTAHIFLFEEFPSFFMFFFQLFSTLICNFLFVIPVSVVMKMFALFPVFRDKREITTAGLFDQFRHRMKENPFLSD